MFEKVEVYPYQRIHDPIILKPRPSINNKKSLIGRFIKNLQAKLSFNLGEEMIALVSINNVLLALGAFIMARALVLEEILPFVFAYIVAFAGRDIRKALLLSVFAIIGFITLPYEISFWSNFLTLIALVGVLAYIKVPAERVWFGLPLITIGVIIISKTIVGVFTGISFYIQMVIIFEAMLAGILTFVFMVGYEVIEKKKAWVDFSFEDMAAFIILGIGVVMGFNELYLAGLSISSIICRVGILVAAFLWGSGGGTMVGVMAGIIPSISSSIFAPTLAMYSISGLLAGLFRYFGRLGVIIGFMLGTLALSAFISETSLTILGMWETGIACLIFMILPNSLKEKMPIRSLGLIDDLNTSDVKMLDTRLKETARTRIENLAAVFDELSATFIEERPVSESRGQTAYLNYLYEEITDRFCKSCSYYESCWGRDCYSTSQEILDLFSIAEINGQLTYEESPQEFKRKCVNANEMINTINYLFDNLRLNEYWSDKLNDTRDLVATQLSGVSGVIKELAQDIDIKTTIDFELRDKLLKEFQRLGLEGIIDITPIRNGADQYYLNVTAESCRTGAVCESDLAMALSSIMKEKLEVCDKKCPRFRGKGPCEFTLTRAFAYKIISGAAQVGKEKICGDSFTIATLKEGKELVALSDGMGIGETACTESQAAVRLLETLLGSGFTREVALKTINSVLMLRSHKDTFATLDMMIIDLYTGEVDFIKIGSAPSFIKRGNKVGVVTSNTLPIGILSDVDIASEKRSLVPGDLLVMVSDGVLEIFRDLNSDLWVAEFLASLNESDPQVVAEMILSKALSLCDGKPADDMTVVCSYIDLNFSH
ncbi:MAG TPA: stage II sporulation protein E [Syntrophomonadaceae bacterium]|nr:stage II sporulation protein E [Syntrophomonadaceae bacterium]